MSKNQEQVSVLSDSQVGDYIRTAEKEYFGAYEQCDNPPSRQEFEEVVERVVASIERETFDQEVANAELEGRKMKDSTVFGVVRNKLEKVLDSKGNPEEFVGRFDAEREALAAEKQQAELDALTSLDVQATESLPEKEQQKAKHMGGTLSLGSR